MFVDSLPYAIGMAVFAVLGSVIVQKTGRYKWALVAGSAIGAIGGGVLYMVGPSTSYAKLAGFQVSDQLESEFIRLIFFLDRRSAGRRSDPYERRV